MSLSFQDGLRYVLPALLMQPSSAAAERVFSLLSNCQTIKLSIQQESALEDIELSVTLQYNGRS